VHEKQVLTNQNFIHAEKKQTKVRECLLSFGVESFVFQSDIQKHIHLKYAEPQLCFLFSVGVKSGLSHTQGGT